LVIKQYCTKDVHLEIDYPSLSLISRLFPYLSLDAEGKFFVVPAVMASIWVFIAAN
jgi:hypothetical protein